MTKKEKVDIVSEHIEFIMDMAAIESDKREFTFFCLFSLYQSARIVPRKVSAFDSYLRNTNTRQLATPQGGSLEYYKLYNWTSIESSAYSAKLAAWTPLYLSYTDPMKVNSTIRQQVRNFIKDFALFAAKYHEKVKSSTTSYEDDANIFDFKYIRAAPSRRTTPIEEICYGLMINTGSGSVKGKVRSVSDSKKSNILDGATGVEVAYKIVWRVGEPETVLIPRFAPDASFTRFFSTNAIFNLTFPNTDSGAILQVFFRWFIVGKPQLSGPWSDSLSKRLM